MPVVDYEQYCNMLDNAYKNHFAYPAINVTSMTTANAALRAFAEKIRWHYSSFNRWR